jgi:hypothetical protein
MSGVRQPPRLATAVLNRLAVADQSMTGDLAEEYHAGRSRYWYWRQVLAVIALAWRRSKARIAGGLAITAVIHYVIGFPTSEFINLLNLWFTPRVPLWFLDYDLHRLWALAFSFVVYHLLGIIVTGLNRRDGVPILLAFVLYLSIWDFQGAGYMARLGAHRFAVYLLWQTAALAAQVAGLLVGGLAFWNPETRLPRSSNTESPNSWVR